MLTDKQKEERKSGIGGSDAAAICGLSKWQTPFTVYQDKLGLSDDSQDAFKEHLHFGSLLEPIVRDEYIRRTGNKIIQQDKMARHPKYPWMIANVDGLLVNDNGALECKTANQYTMQYWGESYTDDFPDEYLLQCAHYAIVKDVDFVELAVLIGGSTFRTYKYKRNANLEEKLIEKEREFWNEYVLAEIPPPPINKNDAAKMWREAKGGLETATNEILTDIARFRKIAESIKQLEADKDQLELLLKIRMKESEGFADNYGNILLTWKNQETKRFDLNTFKTKHPSLYTEFLKASNSRVFRVRSFKSE